jgi:hypothetical protein
MELGRLKEAQKYFLKQSSVSIILCGPLPDPSTNTLKIKHLAPVNTMLLVDMIKFRGSLRWLILCVNLIRPWDAQRAE